MVVEIGAELDPVHFLSGAQQKKAGQASRYAKAPKGANPRGHLINPEFIWD